MTKIISFSAVSVFGLLFTMISYAKKTETPMKPSNPDVRRVTAKEADDLLKGGAVMVDVRKKIEFSEEHIKGAIHVPYKEKKKFSAKSETFDMSKDKFPHEKLPSDKKLVFYCNGPTCWKSFKAVVWTLKNRPELKQNLWWLRGGIPEWKQSKLATSLN